MSASISAFGAFHTAISLAAIPLGFWAFFRNGKIDTTNALGKAYFATMFVGSVTAFGIFRHGTFTPGHVLSAITLLLLFSGWLAPRFKRLGRAVQYIETFSYSATFLLLWIFTTTETFTRLPSAKPIASGPDDPVLIAVHLGLLTLFILGVGYQTFMLRADDRRLSPAVNTASA